MPHRFPFAPNAILAAAGLCFIQPALAQNVADAAAQRVEITGESAKPYAVTTSTSGTKSDTPLVDTPMAVQAVSREVIQDRQLTSSLDAVRNVSGVQSQPGSFYDQFQIRGFGSGYGLTYRNGLQLEGVADAVDMAFVDRIEVVKGPASMLYGRVEPGGFVNVVTKAPATRAALSVEQQFASWGRRQTTLDATGPLNADNTLAYRLIGDLVRADEFYDFQHHDRKAVYAALAYRPAAAIEVNVSLEFDDQTSGGRGPNAVVPHVGDRPAAGFSRSRSGSDPTVWANFPDTVRRSLLAFDWSYRFSDQWKLTQRFHAMHVAEVQTGLGDWGGVWGFIDNPLTRDSFHTNLDLSGRFSTGSVGHELLVGADAYRYKDDWHGYVGATSLPAISIYDPGYVDVTAPLRALAGASRGNTLWQSRWGDTGLYLQDRMTLTAHWSVLLGGRWDHAWQRYSAVYGAADAPCYPNCTGQPTNSWPADTAFSPRAAALYKLDADSSVYASYAKSFGSSNSAWLASGSFVPPEVGEQFELGAKRSLMDDRLMLSATLFDLTKRNVLAPDPNDRTRQIAIGEVRSRGLELDAAGQLTPVWSTVASYTLNPVTLSRDTNEPSNQGHRRAGAPLHSASLWLKYGATRNGATGWSFGAGVYANGQRQGDDANSWQMPGYATLDAMVAYRTRLAGRPVELQFNVKNLFDRVYYDQIGYGTAAYGAPRSFAGKLRVEL